MKKVFSMILLVAMLLAMVGCGAPAQETTTTAASEDATTEITEEMSEMLEETAPATTEALDVLKSTEGFRVGYARIDITPSKSVPLGGFGNTSKRMSTSILRRIYATCVAVADEEDNLALLYATDVQSSAFFLNGRSLVAMQLGIPEYQVAVNASHTHAGPDGTNSAEPNIVEWLTEANLKIIEVGLEAVKDLKPATVAYGSVETEHMNFIKHYKHTLADGTEVFFGDNFGTQVLDETTQHATQIDETMHIIQFTREGAKPVVMTNWRAHPLMDGASSKYELSSDFIGTFREAMELKYDCQFVFFQGAAGNNNSKTRLTEERRTIDTAEYGSILADYAIEGLQNLTQVEPGLIQARQTMYNARCNHDTDSLYAYATVVRSVWQSTNSQEEAKAAGAPYGIRSPYHANAIVARYNRAQNMEVELDAIAIGDYISFVTAPNELYDTLSVMTEDDSPYAMTMTLGYTNGYSGYIPSAYGWEYTSYESDVSWFAPGTGEEFVDCFLSMLDEMAK